MSDEDIPCEDNTEFLFPSLFPPHVKILHPRGASVSAKDPALTDHCSLCQANPSGSDPAAEGKTGQP